MVNSLRSKEKEIRKLLFPWLDLLVGTAIWFGTTKKIDWQFGERGERKMYRDVL